MTPAEIAALIVGGGGILASLLTFITSARNSDLDAVSKLIDQQRELIATLQDGLEDEHSRCSHLEDTVRQLRSELTEAQKMIREYQQRERERGSSGRRW
jgi:septal ring factor EnvC (AmiA/AmiB activator)